MSDFIVQRFYFDLFSRILMNTNLSIAIKHCISLSLSLTVIVASTTVSSALPPVPLSLVDLGKRLLDASKRGDTYEIRTLMSSGAPFTTDWVSMSMNL